MLYKIKMPTDCDHILVIDWSNFIHACWWPAVDAQEADPKYDAKLVLRNNMLGKLQSIQTAMSERKLDNAQIIFVEDREPALQKLEIWPEYKANRGLREPRPPKDEAKEWLVSQGFYNWSWADGFEADDAIASLIRVLKPLNVPIIVVSSDRDLWQLIEEGVEIFRTTTNKFVTEEALLKDFETKDPRHIPLYKALWGDSGDNVPNAVPRMQKQLLPYIRTTDGSLEDFEAKLQFAKLTERCRELLTAGRNQVGVNWKLVKLRNDLQLTHMYYGASHG